MRIFPAQPPTTSPSSSEIAVSSYIYLMEAATAADESGRVERAVLKVKEDPVCSAAMRRRSGRDGLGGAGAKSLGRFICIIDRGHDMRRPSHNEFFHCRPFVSRDRRRSDNDLSRRPLKDPLMTEKPDTVRTYHARTQRPCCLFTRSFFLSS